MVLDSIDLNFYETDTVLVGEKYRLKYFIFRQEIIKLKKLSIQGKKIKKDAQEK